MTDKFYKINFTKMIQIKTIESRKIRPVMRASAEFMNRQVYLIVK